MEGSSRWAGICGRAAIATLLSPVPCPPAPRPALLPMPSGTHSPGIFFSLSSNGASHFFSFCLVLLLPELACPRSARTAKIVHRPTCVKLSTRTGRRATHATNRLVARRCRHGSVARDFAEMSLLTRSQGWTGSKRLQHVGVTTNRWRPRVSGAAQLLGGGDLVRNRRSHSPLHRRQLGSRARPQRNKKTLIPLSPLLHDRSFVCSLGLLAILVTG